MPLEHLLVALERDARAHMEALLAEARATADVIARATAERVDRRRGDVLGVRESELRGTAEAALGEARRAGRRAVLGARQGLLDRVFATAQALFPEAIIGTAYRAALPDHLAQALACIGEEPAVIRCPEVLVPAVQAAVTHRKDVAVQGDPAARPGVAVVTTDGVVAVDNTLEGRLERLRPRLAIELLARLETSL